MDIDGECIVCGKFTDKICDSCEITICELHGIETDEAMPNFFCPKCKKENKKPKIMKKAEIFSGLTTK